jgi:hypothetical protein
MARKDDADALRNRIVRRQPPRRVPTGEKIDFRDTTKTLEDLEIESDLAKFGRTSSGHS